MSSVVILSAAFGAAGGFFAASIAARQIDVGRVFFGISGAWIGVLLAPLVGVLFYKTMLRSVLYLHELLVMAFSSIAVACITARLLRPPGWSSAGAALLCTFLWTIYFSMRREAVEK